LPIDIRKVRRRKGYHPWMLFAVHGRINSSVGLILAVLRNFGQPAVQH
jgi:hypothetical protein